MTDFERKIILATENTTGKCHLVITEFCSYFPSSIQTRLNVRCCSSNHDTIHPSSISHWWCRPRMHCFCNCDIGWSKTEPTGVWHLPQCAWRGFGKRSERRRVRCSASGRQTSTKTLRCVVFDTNKETYCCMDIKLLTVSDMKAQLSQISILLVLKRVLKKL
jgi:hypothetical protein